MMSNKLEKYDEMMTRLRQINQEGGKLDGDGVAIGVRRGYISGMPYLTSSDFNNAFAFKNTAQAQAFIDAFREELDQPRIIDRG